MNVSPRWRRIAVKLARHAASVLPAASPWAQAMRRELDYIENDRAALAWALGCVLASYKARLAAGTKAGLGRLRRLSSARNRKHPMSLSGARTWEVLRHAAASAALMLAVGLALLENGGGQAAPAPFPAVLDETACGKADKAPELSSDFGPDFGSDLDRNPARTLPSGVVTGRPAPETSCAGRNAPGRVRPKYDTP
jgi:hypothetical protein